MDFSQVLHDKTATIVDQWVKAVFEDQSIEVTEELTFKEVQNSLPRVLQALATVLSQSEESDLQTVVDASLEHGRIRAEQGFEPAEIAREYRLLRFVIFAVLEPDLLQAASPDILRAVRLIDTIIDEAIARCFNSYTQGRLRELEQLKSQLQLTNQELTRLVRTSRENLSKLAHELKTPLTSIIGYADLFLRQQQNQTTLKDSQPNLENIEQVLRSGRLLLRLINDSLEISRYNAGQMTIQPVQVNVPTLLNTVVEMIQPLIKSRNLSFSMAIETAPTDVYADPLRLQQILTNLLSNAIRYTLQGSVQLKCWQLSDQRWAIAVRDSGVGIAPADYDRIFTPYVRVENTTTASETKESEGTGLGLAIVAQLVTLMQGEIEVRSSLGTGSTFTVYLPLVFSAAPPTEIGQR